MYDSIDLDAFLAQVFFRWLCLVPVDGSGALGCVPWVSSIAATPSLEQMASVVTTVTIYMDCVRMSILIHMRRMAKCFLFAKKIL